MQHFYDGQIRRYLVQTIRVFSNFVVKYGDNTLHRVPVMYGDADRQVASIMRGNSENKVNSVPRISVYVSAFALDRDRLSDSSFVGKVHIREREINDSDPSNPIYTTGQGRNYTVERLMPTPFKLTMKVDIWSANTDQKLQILEQILVLFNPSLELQTTDNYIDWTSLSVLNLNDINWSSRTVPVGNDTPIEVATLTVDTPVWISPPVKVKHLGVITKIITSMYNGASTDPNDYIEGLGKYDASSNITLGDLLSRDITTISGNQIQIYADPSKAPQTEAVALLLGSNESVRPIGNTLDVTIRQGDALNWEELFEPYPGKYIAGASKLFLTQPNGMEVVGSIVIDPLDNTKLRVTWLSKPTNDPLEPYDNGYNRANGKSAGTFDAIIDPYKIYPGHGIDDLQAGDRFLLVDDIVYDAEEDYSPEPWRHAVAQPVPYSTDTTYNFVANANDIIEWRGDHWIVAFDSQNYEGVLTQTNIYTGVQYVWNNVMWSKSFEGEYDNGSWRIEL